MQILPYSRLGRLGWRLFLFQGRQEFRGRSAHTLLGCNHVDLKFRANNRSNESLSGLILGLASVR